MASSSTSPAVGPATSTPTIDALNCLADAPMFIDAGQIERFFDAVVRPAAKETSVTLRSRQEARKQISGELTASGKISLGGWIASVLGFGAEAEVGGKAGAEKEKTSEESQERVLEKIHTPQRQLVELVVFYLGNQPNRLAFVPDASKPEWRDPKSILETPRKLVFLDIPGITDSTSGIVQFRAIPTAVEFESGKVERIFKNFRDKDGNPPPDYPEVEAAGFDPLGFQKYWQWFITNVTSKVANEAVENAVETAVADQQNGGRIRWIDFRVPITNSGETLHLHFAANGQHDTGVFAYQFCRRGRAHGMRIIGTLKSGPAMNVLAVYER